MGSTNAVTAVGATVLIIAVRVAGFGRALPVVAIQSICAVTAAATAAIGATFFAGAVRLACTNALKAELKRIGAASLVGPAESTAAIKAAIFPVTVGYT